MKASLIAAALVAAVLSTSAKAAVQFVTNGDFTELSNGLGKLNVDTVATGWTNGYYSDHHYAYNFVYTDGNISDDGVHFWTASNIQNGDTNTWNGLTASGVGNFVALDGAYQTGPLAQTISNLTVGVTYTLSFNYAFAQQHGFNGETWQDLTASIGSLSVTLPSPFSDCTGGDGDGQTCTGGYDLPSHGFSGWATYTTSIIATSTTETLSFLADGSKAVPPFALLSDVSVLGPSTPEASTWEMMLAGFAGLSFLGYRARRKAAVAA